MLSFWYDLQQLCQSSQYFFFSFLDNYHFLRAESPLYSEWMIYLIMTVKPFLVFTSYQSQQEQCSCRGEGEKERKSINKTLWAFFKKKKKIKSTFVTSCSKLWFIWGCKLTETFEICWVLLLYYPAWVTAPGIVSCTLGTMKYREWDWNSWCEPHVGSKWILYIWGSQPNTCKFIVLRCISYIRLQKRCFFFVEKSP